MLFVLLNASKRILQNSCDDFRSLGPDEARCYDKDLQTDFIYFTQCTDTGVIVTHALYFYRPLAPLFLSTHAQLAVVTQSCALLYTTADCDLLLQ